MTSWLRRLGGVFTRARHERELTEELDAHLQAHIDDNLRAGMTADDARRHALLVFGGVEAAKEGYRDRRGLLALDAMLRDARYALRTLHKSPGFSATAILTMALGIAATTTLFGIMSGVLLKPLPWTDSDQLLRLTESRGGRAGRVAGTISNGTYLAWRDKPSTIEALGGWTRAQAVTLGDDGDPLRIQVTRVTPTLFAVLKARPQLGRMLIDEDGVAGGTARGRDVVVLSYGLWQERFGGRDDVIGRAIRLDGETTTVVGVMPRSFAFPDRDTRAWAPFVVPQVRGKDGVIRGAIFSGLARLKPGVTRAAAAAEATARAHGAADLDMAAVALFGNNQDASVTAESALQAMTADVRPGIVLLFGGAGLLLLTAMANVASLQLARAVARRREIAIRRAIGAGTGQIARQLVIESAIVGTIGGAIGIGIAALLYRIAPSILPPGFPRADSVAIDADVAMFAVAVTMLASIVCGLLPAWHVQSSSLVGSLVQDGAIARPGFALLRTVHIRTLIMTGQLAVACVLLAGAGLLGRSFVAMLHADRGYEPANVLTATVPFPSSYSPARRIQILEALLTRVGVLPGISVASFGNALPYVSAGFYRGAKMRPPRDPGTELDVSWIQRIVSPAYFEALRLRVQAGRALTDTDTAASPSAVVVNRSFANKYLTDRAIGDRLPIQLRADRLDVEVVGIVDDMRQGDVVDPAQPEIFASYRQVMDTQSARDPVLVIRTTLDPASYATAIRSLLRSEDSSLALDSVMTMEDRVESSLVRPRTYAVVLAGFGICALVVAGVGLFGLLAYSVAQRTKEIGVRTALGARSGHIVSLVLRPALVVTGAGLGLGLGATFALGAVLRRFLYGVTAYDGLTMIEVAAVLTSVTIAASLIPVRRATRVNPLIALRAE